LLYRKLIEDHLNDNKVIISDENRNLTYAQIHEKVAQYCAFFQRKNLKQGDRIVVIDNNPVNTAIVLLACIAGGYIFVPVNSALGDEDRAYIEADCCPALKLDEEINEAERGEKVLEKRKLWPKETEVYIIYTSGSEGIPKGVTGSQKQVFFCCEGINQRLKNDKSDRILCCLPLSFDYGMYQVFLALFSGAHLYLETGKILQKIPYFLDKWKITAFPTIPTVANILVKTGMLRGMTLSELRYISFTGEVLSTNLIGELKEILPEVRIIPMYGLTECKRVAVMPEGCEEKVRKGSCGLPLSGVKVWLESVDSETQVGELIVSGDNVMEGYWNHIGESSSVFFVDEKSGERCVRTGDICRIDEEGFLYFCGRKNNIIKIRGYRISGASIENRIKGIDGVIETVVTGIPDEITGEKLAIYVYACQESNKRRITEELEKLPDYMQNYSLYLCDHPLPQNKNGKIDIRKLQKWAKEKC